MTVKFYRNLNWDGLAEGTLAELFDPRVNRAHGADDETGIPFHEITIDDFLVQLREVYTLEAIQAHVPMFFPSLDTSTIPPKLKQILENLSESERLHYAMFLFRNYSGDIFGYIPSQTTDWSRKKLYNRETDRLDPAAINSWREACWNVLELYDENSMQSIFNGNITLNTLGFRLADFMLGRYYAYADRPFSITDLLATESYDIRIDRGDIYVDNLRQRAGVVRRSNLYRVMSYNARATTEIAEQKLHTKKRGDKEHPTTRGELLYGLELELATDHSVRTLIDSQESPFFICKADSSISGRGNQYMECVTVPMDYRAQRKAWGTFFSKFWKAQEKKPNGAIEKEGYKGFDTSTQTTNGMHIHMTKSAFEATPGHLKRFCWMICKPAHLDFIVHLSERGNNLNHYCRMPTFPAQHDTNKKKFDGIISTICSNGRGAVAVNTSSGRTIEVRLFKGIVSYASLLKNLEFCDALYYYTQAMPYSKLTLENFVLWLNNKMADSKPPREYKALKLFIEKTPDSIWKLSSIRERIQTTNNPAELVQVLNEMQAEPDDTINNLVTNHLSRSGLYAPACIYYGREGWTLKKSKGIEGSNLSEYEETLNPFVKYQKAA